MSRAWAGGSDRRWRAFRAWVLDRDGHTCRLRLAGCTGVATQVDHITPVSVDPSGKLDPANVRASCARCNQGRGATPDHELTTAAEPSRPW